MNSQLNNTNTSSQEDFSDYVAHLQVHMSLQSRHLLPQVQQNSDRRSNLLYETQAMTEKLASRQFTSPN